jgi:hypothetical protein
MSDTIGKKHDSGKPRWSLLPWQQVEQVVDVLTFGAKKYEEYNWQRVPDPQDRYGSAAMRHISAWMSGEIFDPESGKHHLSHAVCCLLFLMWFDCQVTAESSQNGTKV